VISKILKEITEQRVLTMLSDLVSIPSPNPPGAEGPVAAYVAETLRQAGCQVSTESALPDRPNVVATYGAGKPCFVFNTHMDVVPAGESSERDLFRPTLIAGRLHGRGTVDAKGSLAAMMAAAMAFAARQVALKGTLALTAVADEEGRSAGAKHLFRSYRGDFGVVGEPTHLQVMIAHRGSLRCVIAVDGISSHSAHPSRGVNAIYEALPVIERLRDLGLRFQERGDGLCGPPTLSVTKITAGLSSNMIPDRCEILVDRRLIPGETEESALREIEGTLEELRRARPKLQVHVDRTIETTGGPSETDRGHRIVRIASEAVREATGTWPQIGGLSVACDMVHLVGAGIPTVVLGPGDVTLAHTSDESVSIAEVHTAAKVYALMAWKALGGSRADGDNGVAQLGGKQDLD
jgi:acetylornithine deacetylase/succinyl-diaminopimelate desuccinylase family protein